MYSTYTFVDDEAGGYEQDDLTGVKVPGSGYFSPWDIWYNRGADYVDYQPSYMFINGNDDPEAQSFSPYDLGVIPYVGLAYYDGDNNGRFDDFRTGASYDLTALNAYPNLYTVNNQEVGNLVQMQSFIIPPNKGVTMEDRFDHLPLGAATKYPSGNPNIPDHFQFSGILTAQEEFLLQEYGKVFFYEVNVYENGLLVENFVLYPYVHNLFDPSAKWEPAIDSASGTHLQGNHPTLGSAHDLHYYYYDHITPTHYDPTLNPDNKCNSHEVVFDVSGITANSYQITNGSTPLTITLGFQQHPFKFWQSSSLVLIVHK